MSALAHFDNWLNRILEDDCAKNERDTIAFEKRLEELENDPLDLGEQIQEQALTKDELQLIGMAVQAFAGTSELIRKLAARDV